MPKAFFDLDGFMKKEIDYLKTEKPEVLKKVKINDASEELTSKAIDWDKDLEIIKQSDLNKAAYRLSYDINEAKSLISYNLKTEENLPIKSLLIHKNDKGQITKITSEHINHNYLYSSSNIAEVNFENGHLKTYSVKGWQKLFVGSKKDFEIVGRVIL